MFTYSNISNFKNDNYNFKWLMLSAHGIFYNFRFNCWSSTIFIKYNIKRMHFRVILKTIITIRKLYLQISFIHIKLDF